MKKMFAIFYLLAAGSALAIGPNTNTNNFDEATQHECGLLDKIPNLMPQHIGYFEVSITFSFYAPVGLTGILQYDVQSGEYLVGGGVGLLVPPGGVAAQFAPLQQATKGSAMALYGSFGGPAMTVTFPLSGEGGSIGLLAGIGTPGTSCMCTYMLQAL